MNQHHLLLVKNEQEECPVVCAYAGGHFNLSKKGLAYIGSDKEGSQLAPCWISSPLYVIAKTRDSHNGEWGRLLEWQDDDGIKHRWAMPLALLQSDSSEVRRELARLGLTISPNKTARDLLAAYLQVFPVKMRARCVDKLGWHGGIFVTTSESIGQSSERVVFQNTHAIQSASSVSGTVSKWRDSIGRLASGNTRLIFALSAAFAPSLANIVGEDSGGFHFRGASSSGKTTALKIAASVWGEPSAYCRLWRATANGLEGLAALHNDGLLILDELSQIDPKEAGEAAYLLANGQGKSRATCYGTVKQSARWSLLFLSAGEESLSALMAKAGQRPNAGQEIRLADIEADAGAGMGILEQLHEQSTPAAMALGLKEYASRYHGDVGLAWLRQIVSNRQQLSNELAKSMQQFIEGIPLRDCPGQILRVARRFALVAAAGELASQYGLTGWTEGEAFSATHTCFKSWLNNFGFNGNREDRMILCQVRAFFESYGASRFESVNNPNNEGINHRAGFFRTADNGERIYMVLPEVFRNELCQRYDLRIAARALINAGWIEPGNDGKASQKLRIRGIGIPRLYVFTSRMWGDEGVQSY